MTSNPRGADRLEDPVGDVLEIFERTRVVLLDFDGPVADLFPKGCGSRIADEVREPVLRRGVRFPDAVGRTVEHLLVLEFVAERAPEMLDEVERIAVAGEVEAARTAPVTAGVREFLVACAEVGKPVVVVSNNAAPAIEAFLGRQGLDGLVRKVVGRPYARPDLMKPNPDLIAEALVELGCVAGDCVMVGDSVSDIEFSRRAGAQSVGYAKSPARGIELAEADAIVYRMADLADAVAW
jgi:beta-phosphoglucomutase-like phosphatase (HAD superfamily)